MQEPRARKEPPPPAVPVVGIEASAGGWKRTLNHAVLEGILMPIKSRGKLIALIMRTKEV